MGAESAQGVGEPCHAGCGTSAAPGVAPVVNGLYNRCHEARINNTGNCYVCAPAVTGNGQHTTNGVH